MADIDVTISADASKAISELKKAEAALEAQKKKAEAALEAQKKKSEELQDALKTLSITAGAAFASLVFGAKKAFDAFEEGEKATNQLRVAIRNQGLDVAKLTAQYKTLADSVSAKTGVDDDQITSGQAILQTFLGQQKVTEGLTETLAELTAKTGSSTTAAELLGKAINGQTRGLQVYGIALDANSTRTERITALSNSAALGIAGFAKSQNLGAGSTFLATKAFNDFLKVIGAKLVPVIDLANVVIAKFFNALAENEALGQLVFELGALAGIILGGVTGLLSLSFAFSKVTAAIGVAKSAITLLGLTTRAAVGATGIGLLLIVIAEIALHWNSVWPALTAVYETFVGNISRLATAAGKILFGIKGFNTKLISDGVDEVSNIIQRGVDRFDKIKDKANDPAKENARTAAEVAAQQARQKKIDDAEANAQATRQANRELDLLQAQQGSDAAVELKKKEIETLKALKDVESEEDRARLEASLSENRRKQEEAFFADVERRTSLNDDLLAIDAEFMQKSEADRQDFIQRNAADLEKSILTEKEAQNKADKDKIKAKIDVYNKFREEGVAFAAFQANLQAGLNQVEQSGFVKGTRELLPLVNSKYQALKSIGKAAAVTDITIKTAQSAMNVFNGFSAIPIVGVPLGLAAAAAVVLYGAEQIDTVLSAQRGGVVPGFNQGGDSIKSILQPGELVVPRQNFDEVISAVAESRANQSVQATAGVGPAPGAQAGGAFELRFSGDNAEKFLTARRVEARNLGTLRDGVA